ncbi:MAG: hypothetical protein J1E58_02575, partial [Prevotella sp.]|nr:hypothetical protein [Prevotella sp.]
IEPKMAHCGAQNDARWSTEWNSVALYPPKLPPHFLYFTHFRSVKIWIVFLTLCILFYTFLVEITEKVLIYISLLIIWSCRKVDTNLRQNQQIIEGQTIENKTLSNVKKCGVMNSEIRLYIL